MEEILPPFLLMLRGRIMLVQENTVKDSSKDSKKEEKEVATIATGLAIMLESFLTRRILQGMMTTTTTTTTKAMAIKGITGSMINERGMLALFKMEMGDLPKRQEIPGMRKVML